jgi:ribosomal protein S18 acetylase RimI-like enzyme
MGIFLATDTDIQSIVSLVNAAYRGDAGWTNESHLLEGARTNAADIARLLTEGVILTYRADELLGCMYLQPQTAVLYMGLLSVLPGRQDEGIGKKLLTAAVDYARERGLPRIRITVLSARLDLIAWYERHGYVRTGEIEPFPAGRIFGVQKRELELVILERPVS